MNPWQDLDPLDLGDSLLDRQIVGEDGTVVGKVDDLELREDDRGRYVIDTVLTGSWSLADRLDGLLGRLLRRIGARLHTTAPHRIPISAIREIEPAIVVTTAVARASISPSEEWLRRTIIDRIPGAGDAG
ncbi:hypothetical protein ACFWIW_24575 [Amycolatopsis sp. NPDC058340]|uniref:hypothetical protein n=1 Tax=Amycolatopsis sp. NPDC058340 TaxID=3346453 RepID=UPI0036677E64